MNDITTAELNEAVSWLDAELRKGRPGWESQDIENYIRNRRESIRVHGVFRPVSGEYSGNTEAPKAASMNPFSVMKRHKILSLVALVLIFRKRKAIGENIESLVGNTKAYGWLKEHLGGTDVLAWVKENKWLCLIGGYILYRNKSNIKAETDSILAAIKSL